MKKTMLTLGFMAGAVLLHAQNDVDALRYSFIKSGYTAKAIAIGGATGALGADVSSAGVNPAAMAQYKGGELSFSAAFNNILNTSDYDGNIREENLFKAGVPSVGLVFTHRKIENGVPAKTGWVNVNFGMNMGRVADFNRINAYGGLNKNSSLLDYFAERSNGISPDLLRATNNEFDYGFRDDETMAWESYLIDHAGNNQYVAHIDPMNRNIQQKGVITGKGGMHEINFSLAANYSNTLYLGGTLKVTTVKYEETNRFTEINDPASALGWNNFQYTRNLNTTGTGVSGVLGMVYRPNQNIRIGLSYNTPVNLNLDDEYSSTLKTVFDTGAVYDYRSVKGTYAYEIQTPAKTTLSAAYLFEKRGFISADFDAVNYSTMRLRPEINEFEAANDMIRSKYALAYNMRIGGEYVQDVFRFRAGYARYGNPFRDNSSELTSQSISGGLGIKEKSWGLDLGINRLITQDMVQPYVLNRTAVPVSNGKWTNTQVMVTMTANF